HHFGERKPKFFGQQRPRDLDETEISDIRHNPAAIGIEEHDPHFGANARRLRFHCKIDIIAFTTSGTLISFMHRKSIGHSRRKHGLHSTWWRTRACLLPIGPVSAGSVEPDTATTRTRKSAAR